MLEKKVTIYTVIFQAIVVNTGNYIHHRF